MKKFFYAVRVGKATGIYETWAECQAQTIGVTNACYKKFKTKPEAEEFMKEGRTTDTEEETVASASSSICKGCKKEVVASGVLCKECKGWWHYRCDKTTKTCKKHRMMTEATDNSTQKKIVETLVGESNTGDKSEVVAKDIADEDKIIVGETDLFQKINVIKNNNMIRYEKIKESEIKAFRIVINERYNEETISENFRIEKNNNGESKERNDETLKIIQKDTEEIILSIKLDKKGKNLSISGKNQEEIINEIRKHEQICFLHNGKNGQSQMEENHQAKKKQNQAIGNDKGQTEHHCKDKKSTQQNEEKIQLLEEQVTRNQYQTGEEKQIREEEKEQLEQKIEQLEKTISKMKEVIKEKYKQLQQVHKAETAANEVLQKEWQEKQAGWEKHMKQIENKNRRNEELIKITKEADKIKEAVFKNKTKEMTEIFAQQLSTATTRISELEQEIRWTTVKNANVNKDKIKETRQKESKSSYMIKTSPEPQTPYTGKRNEKITKTTTTNIMRHKIQVYSEKA